VRVLIADDSEVVVLSLNAALAVVHGVEVVGQAGSVPEAIQAIRALRPDVLVLDISMPGGSGIDVLEDMRKEDIRPIIIVLTNFSYPQYRKRCLQLGARFFFDKSADFERVAEVVQGLAQTSNE
jgi:DNA-binding NarL/FixJ family response regulator